MSTSPTVAAPVAALAEHGVSVWLDDLSRDLVRSGDLARLVRLLAPIEGDRVEGIGLAPRRAEQRCAGGRHGNAVRPRRQHWLPARIRTRAAGRGVRGPSSQVGSR